MTLVKILPKTDGSILRIYKNPTTGSYTNILKTNDSIKIGICDRLGTPKIIHNVNKHRQDTYIKSCDGSTIWKNGNKITTLPHVIFNELSNMFFR